MTPHEELVAHERLCAERYATIHKRLDRIESMITKLIWTILAALIGTLLAVVSSAKAETRTIIEQRGMPVPTAIAPSISAYSQDLCVVTGAVSGGIISVAGGTAVEDDGCQRRKYAKVLNDLGLKVAAVSVMCEDIKVWNAMELSGSPCPIGGATGVAARSAWYDLHPERFTKLYGKEFVLVVPLNME
jgi:acid phosphatase family membrane protein YuiD